MDAAALFQQFGAWGVVIIAMIWLAKFLSEQLDKAREDRNTEAVRHSEEVKELTQVIQNNTLAITKLTDYIMREDANNA